MQTNSRLFRGSELPRLVVLSAIMVAGWVMVLMYAQERPRRAEPSPRAESNPAPAVADPAVEFETVTDRTAMSFRDNAAYSHLLEKARGLTPAELAQESRRDILLTHLWERPEQYRGVPIHLMGTAVRVLRFESKLSKTGWLYEAWIVTRDAPKYPYDCVFEEAPDGFPLGAEVSERVAFNGYFLKLMKYQAGDVMRGAPVLVGKIGWTPEEGSGPGPGPFLKKSDRTLHYTLAGLSILFTISLGRWLYQQFRYFSGPRPRPSLPPSDDIHPEALNDWIAEQAESNHDPDGDRNVD